MIYVIECGGELGTQREEEEGKEKEKWSRKPLFDNPSYAQQQQKLHPS
jgi:hypothetical protein